jgi:hypothetical protein
VRAQLSSAVLLVSSILAAQAHAESNLLWNLPTKLDASSSGTADASVGVGVLRPTARATWNGTLDYRVQTKSGAATLLGANQSGTPAVSLPWGIGLTISYIDFGALGTPVPVGGDSPMVSATKEAVAICSAECDARSSNKKDFCDARDEARKVLEDDWIDKHTVHDDELCPVGVLAAGKLATQIAQISSKEYDGQRHEIVRSCLQSCAKGLAAPFCALIKQPIESDVRYHIKRKAFCSSGQKRIADAEIEYADYRPFPPLMANVGVRVGQSQFKFYSANPDQTLTSSTVRPTDVTAGTSGAFILYGEGKKSFVPTLEWLALYQRKYQASDGKVHWCSPAGMVRRPGSPDAMPLYDPVETCHDEVLGGPARAREFRFAGQVGLLGGSDGAWRAAMGPMVELPTFGDGKVKYRLSWNALVLFSTTSGPATLKYRGLIKVGPTIFAEKRRDGSMDTGALLNLFLGGDRLLFSPNFDEL